MATSMLPGSTIGKLLQTYLRSRNACCQHNLVFLDLTDVMHQREALDITDLNFIQDYC